MYCTAVPMIPALAALLALSAGQRAGPRSSDYSRIAAETEANLRKQVLAMWYPRAVDRVHGGFAEDYDAQWKPHGSELQRSIVYQARLTWTAARACRHDPKLAPTYREYAHHGLDYLRDGMWDRQNGGFFWQIEAAARAGGQPTPARGGEKHAYGIAFGIYAAADGYALTHDPRDLDLAKRAFTWLDTHAHDGAHGGYYEALTRDGTPLLVGPTREDVDEIGTRYGLKSMNTHIHLLEALTALYEVWPDRLVRDRLDEVFHVVRDRVYWPDGYLNMFFKPDWTPTSRQDSYGHDIETAFLLDEAATALGYVDAETHAVSQRLVDHALQFGWDAAHGGFYDSGPAGKPATALDKVWWTQAEGLNALLLMHHRHGAESPKYWQAFVKQWQFIQRFQVDHTYGGWRSSVAADGKARPALPKSDQWTECYHQGRALMNVTERLWKLALLTHSRP